METCKNVAALNKLVGGVYFANNHAMVSCYWFFKNKILQHPSILIYGCEICAEQAFIMGKIVFRALHNHYENCKIYYLSTAFTQ